MQFSEEDFIKLTELCRIECTEEEKEKLFHSLNDVLAYVAQISSIDTENVIPCHQVLEHMTNVMRDDEISDILPREDFLKNAPEHVGGMIKVPTFIDYQ